jgi:hydrogenase expression/formation protein HypE
MHDPTEGGIAGALKEMVEAAGCGCLIYESRLNIRSDTHKLTQHFQINPLHLISSGALLVTVHPNELKQLLKTFEANDISASHIGYITQEKEMLLDRNGKTEKLEAPETDALWAALKKLL